MCFFGNESCIINRVCNNDCNVMNCRHELQSCICPIYQCWFLSTITETKGACNITMDYGQAHPQWRQASGKHKLKWISTTDQVTNIGMKNITFQKLKPMCILILIDMQMNYDQLSCRLQSQMKGGC